MRDMSGSAPGSSGHAESVLGGGDGDGVVAGGVSSLGTKIVKGMHASAPGLLHASGSIP